MSRDAHPLVTRSEVVVRDAAAPDLAVVAGLLDRAERETGTPLVDEAERVRLDRALGGHRLDTVRWRPAVAWRGEQVVGYVAVVVEPDGGWASGDAAAFEEGALAALLAGAARLADDGAAGRLRIWNRRGGDRQVEVARAEGFEVARRLAVLGRSLAEPVPVAPASSATVRAYRPGVDGAAVVEILAAAYAGTADEGWDREHFEARTRLPWFRAEDLLVAELESSPGPLPHPPLAGLHWLKRRDEPTGEVYNLAVHPAAQGQGLGPLLLHAGLEHLREQGCREVILWVDRENEAAVRLYTSQGFTTRWEDLALDRAR